MLNPFNDAFKDLTVKILKFRLLIALAGCAESSLCTQTYNVDRF